MAALLAGVLAASRADAQHMGAGSGAGSGKSAVTAPATKDSGTAAERADRPARPSYGESAEAGASGVEAHETWKSGDLVRSWTSADVRASRQQQAPDLEWTTVRDAAPGGQSPPSHRREVRKERGVTKR